MTTPLGKHLRKMRIERDERLLDMAAKLEISVAFLSAVESGRKAPPSAFVEKVVVCYDLDKTMAEKLALAADQSRTSFKISPHAPLARDTVALLARKLDALPESRLHELMRILNKEDDE